MNKIYFFLMTIMFGSIGLFHSPLCAQTAVTSTIHNIPLQFQTNNLPIEPNVLNPELPPEFKEKIKNSPNKRIPKYYYTYRDRDHSSEENLRHIGFIYAISWLVYPITQPEVVRERGSINNYKQNFGKLVFDHDEPFWNWLVHPISGSQLYLYYRATGYSRSSALGMSFISSSLFEFTVEIYTEPASVQDLYQTPVLGSILGLGIETISLYLLNTGNPIGKFIGHHLNPSTFFNFYEGKMRVIPQTDGRTIAGLNLMLEF